MAPKGNGNASEELFGAHRPCRVCDHVEALGCRTAEQEAGEQGETGESEIGSARHELRVDVAAQRVVIVGPNGEHRDRVDEKTGLDEVFLAAAYVCVLVPSDEIEALVDEGLRHFDFADLVDEVIAEAPASAQAGVG